MRTRPTHACSSSLSLLSKSSKLTKPYVSMSFASYLVKLPPPRLVLSTKSSRNFGKLHHPSISDLYHPFSLANFRQDSGIRAASASARSFQTFFASASRAALRSAACLIEGFMGPPVVPTPFWASNRFFLSQITPSPCAMSVSGKATSFGNDAEGSIRVRKFRGGLSEMRKISGPRKVRQSGSRLLRHRVRQTRLLPRRKTLRHSDLSRCSPTTATGARGYFAQLWPSTSCVLVALSLHRHSFRSFFRTH
jgi:hypothetical protein